jgi:hypothetical protein
MFAIQATVATLAIGEAWGKPAGGVTMALVIVVCLYMIRSGKTRPMVAERTPNPV